MFDINLVARNAVLEDAVIIYEWANDEETRRQSFNPERILYENHVAWFKKKIADDNCIFLVFEQDNDLREPVGSIRLDFEGDNKYRLSYQIAPKMRGNGYGKQMLFSLEKVLKEEYNMNDILIEAEVKRQNIASCKCFERNGYSKDEKEAVNIYIKRI